MTSHRKVAYVFPEFPVATQTFAVSDIEALRGIGYEVSVYCIKTSRPDVDVLARTMGVPEDLAISRPKRGLWGASSIASVFRHPTKALQLSRRITWAGGRFSERLLALACIPRVLQIAEQVVADKMDIVHAFWGRHPSLVLAAVQQFGEPVLTSVFVGAYDLVKADFLVDIGLEAADTVFTHSESNRPFFHQRGRTDVNVVHRGIPLNLQNEFRPVRRPELLVTASYLSAEKNTEAVIRAFKLLSESHVAAELAVYGSGPDEGRLRALVGELGLGEKVKFYGYVSRQALFDAMRSATVFVFLSRKPSERLPNVIKEAMLAGCYIVSSRSEGIDELLRDASFGTVVESDEPSDVLPPIISALGETPRDAAARRDRAIEFIQANMSSKHNMKRYSDAWSSARNT